jgi:hypothetical protein
VSLTVPLSVRLITNRSDRRVTKEIRDISYRSVIPGGFASCSISLNRPLKLQPDEVALYGILQVSDTRNGQVLWEGRMEDPGRTAGSEGQIFEIVAIGPSAHARDRTVTLIYNDRRLDENAWQKAYGTTGELINATVAAGENPTFSDDEGLLLTFGNSNSTAGKCCTAVYKALEYAGQNLAFMTYRWDCGISNVNWQVKAFSSGSNEWRSQTSSTAGSGLDNGFLGVDWSLGDRRPVLKFQQVTGGSGGTDDTVWVVYVDLVIVATRYLKTGVERTDVNQAYQTTDGDGILASEVAADLLGRLLTQYDGTNAVIDTTTFRIEQFAFPDGATPEKILEDAMSFEPNTFWAAWERGSTGKYRFEFKVWPTAPRFEADIVDGYDAPGTGADLYSHVLVRYRDKQNRIRHTSGSQTISELTNAVGGSLIRQGFIDLGDEAGGTQVNADQAADKFLDEHRFAPNAGQLTVMRNIVDLSTGRYVAPEEAPLKVPGKLIRIRGVQPRVDALNPVDRDGISIFRCTGAEFSASSAAATLDLESSPFAGRSQAKALSRLMASKVANRRR